MFFDYIERAKHKYIYAMQNTLLPQQNPSLYFQSHYTKI